MNNLPFLFILLIISIITPHTLFNNEVKNKNLTISNSKDKIDILTDYKTSISLISDSINIKLKTLDSLRTILLKNNKKLEILTTIKQETIYYNTHLYIIKGNKFEKEFVKIIKNENN